MTKIDQKDAKIGVLEGLLSPSNEQLLWQSEPNILTDGKQEFPYLQNIAYLRDKPALREQSVKFIKEGKLKNALRVLLKDQDDFAPLPPPENEALDQILDKNTGFLETMRLLNYGPVTEYFAHRTTAPTFLSGLTLLQLGAQKEVPLIEVACGAGHFLRTLEANGYQATGIDLVFSKLWLARKFMNVQGPLICADTMGKPIFKPTKPATVFCHDAFYFFEKKEKVLENLRKLAAGGSIIVGHVHTNAIDHGVSGHPISEKEYRDMAPKNTMFYADKELVDFWLNPNEKQGITPLQSGDHPVVSWIENPSDEINDPLNEFAGELHLNPMLSEGEKGLKINWPTPGYKKEYEAEMPYFNAVKLSKTDLNVLKTASEAHKMDYFKQRILLDTPQL
ncbi:class I SAM-dependent methyltransferase [Flavimarina sp. Hel_I_48]|uniref:class I SAM-dependent methyltransferase n=1 Tax=Flavimarina sp. Hel_I_48 TaxID=1392488 RepID=UPI0004DF88AD|nr:methyltransferase domain-containing protein [Flavimarina sp. Hel_I_48]